MAPRHSDDPPDAAGPAGRGARRGARVVGAAVLGGVIVAAAFGVLRAQAGCRGTTIRGAGGADATVVEVRGLDGSTEGEARGDAGDAGGAAGECSTTIVVDVYVGGAFTQHSDGGPGVSLEKPALVTGYSRRESSGATSPLAGRWTLPVASPYFAAEFAMIDLCSAEEATPSYLRVSCIDAKAKLVTIEYRIRDGHTIEWKYDGRMWEEYGTRDGMPANCATIETRLEKRDLSRLRKAYLDDSPSERCRATTTPRRKVPATFVREVLPKGHKLYEWGKLEPRGAPLHGYCRDVTNVRLVLPPRVGPSQDLGLLFGQCGSMCTAKRPSGFNLAEIRCFEGGAAGAYQLGDDLYVIEASSVRQVPLPCGVKLDFQMADFVASLGIDVREIQER